MDRYYGDIHDIMVTRDDFLHLHVLALMHTYYYACGHVSLRLHSLHRELERQRRDLTVASSLTPP